jgi:hypothetical protein
MFCKRRFAAEDISKKKASFTSSCLATTRARGSRACRLSALPILFLLAACTSGRIAAGRKSDAASAGSRAKGNLPATSTPGAPSHVSEKMLPAIRQELVAGEYTKAHQDLAMVVEHDDQLTRAEQREVKDNLCLTEYLIGQGSYTLSEQQRVCSEALAEPGSVSGAILARIYDSLKQIAAEEVRRALEAQDLADAEALALAYRASPGADSELLAGWSRDFWQVVHGQERPADRVQRVAPLIAKLTNKYSQVKMMSEVEFRHWVIGAATVSNKSIISALTTKGDTLDLLVLERDLATLASNVYEFVLINDVFAARCACDARTNVGVADLGFPVYLFRLDPEENTTKVLIAMGQSAADANLPLVRVPAESLTPAVEAARAVRSTIEPNWSASTEGEPSWGSPSERKPATTNRTVNGIPAPASSHQWSAGAQPKPDATTSKSQSKLQPSRTQPTQKASNEVGSGCLHAPNRPS